jgi:hypothetical protein
LDNLERGDKNMPHIVLSRWKDYTEGLINKIIDSDTICSDKSGVKTYGRLVVIYMCPNFIH